MHSVSRLAHDRHGDAVICAPPWQETPRLIYHGYYPGRAQFSRPEEAYGDWILLSSDEGAWEYGIGEQSGPCAFGDVVVCPPGVTLRRRALSLLSYHVFRFTWCENGDGADACPLIGKTTLHDINRLSSNYAYSRDLAFRTDAASVGWKSHVLVDIVRLSLWEAEVARGRTKKAVHDPVMAQAVVLLQQQACGEVYLRALADSLGLSPVQLTRRFAHAVGATPTVYLTQLRLQKARTLLLETDMTLDAVAEQCGFGSGFYLSRVFSQKMKMSPSHFRKTHRV